MAPFSPRTLRAWSQASVESARIVLPLVFGLSRPASVIDIGCLFGAWAAVARELGAEEVVGVDGAYVDGAALLIPQSSFLARDLAQPLSLDREFDLAISLEVAHYLPEPRATGFVADLCRLAPLVLFSAAIPHQGGVGHVNEQWPSYWAERFSARGYTPVDCIRDEVWDNPRVASWYAQNTLLFVSGDVRSGPLPEHHRFGRSPALVHPNVFMTYASIRRRPVSTRVARRLAKDLRGVARLLDRNFPG